MSDQSSEAITLSTYGDLARRGWRLDGYCRACQRHKQLDLDALPQHLSYMTTKLRCQTCGGLAEISLGGPSKLTGHSRT